MKKTFNFIYKCRMCGVKYISTGIRVEKPTAMANLADTVYGDKYHQLDIHECSSVQTGVGDIQGMYEE